MKVAITKHTIKGKRDHQEDRIAVGSIGKYRVMAVFDGHVGDAASEFCSKRLLAILNDGLRSGRRDIPTLIRGAILRLEIEYCGTGLKGDREQAKHILTKLPDMAGTTAVIAVLDTDCGMVYIGNVGDSRAVLIRNSAVLQLTLDHNIESLTTQEKADIKKSGGYFKEGYLWLDLDPSNKDSFGLNVIKTIGDPFFKSKMNLLLFEKSDIIPCEPDVYEYQLEKGDILALFSDGVSNFISNSVIGSAAASGSAKKLVTTAYQQGQSSDNISAVVAVVG